LILEYGPETEVPRYTLYPATELDVLAFHERFMVCRTVAPEPLAVSDAEVELLVKNDRFAEADPDVLGANVTVNGKL
jgi:hypothetical protein